MEHTPQPPAYTDRGLNSDSSTLKAYPDVLWLIRLRWLAFFGVILAATLAVYLKVIASGLPIFAIAGVMGVFNLYLWIKYRWASTRQADETGGTLIIPQLIFDLASLTLLLHYAGGAENPFAMFYAFHMAIGAVFLPRRTVWVMGLVAALLHAGLVIGEFYEIIPHYPLSFTQPPDLPPHPHRTPHDMHLMPEFIWSYLSAFILMLAGVIYLVQTVAEHQRRAEALRQEHERIAMSRERLARIGEISAGLAHTIRNPLHGVINAAEILRAQPSRDYGKTSEMFNLMMDGLARIERVTTRLLTLTHDSPVRLVNTDIGSLVQEASRFVDSRARKDHINLQVDIGPLPAIPLDPDRIFEAVINLVDNALAACREGGTVTVRAAQCSKPRNGVCIWVEDTGEGIPAHYMSRVMDPFFSTKPVGEGSGLGLPITNRIVEEHGGELHLESEVGKGTKVQIFIPYNPDGRSAEETAP